MDHSISEDMARYRDGIVPDAGAGLLVRQPHGNPGEVYRCPEHSGTACELCGGTGYRSVCNQTVCHEYGCQFGTCSRSENDFLIERRSSDPKEVI